MQLRWHSPRALRILRAGKTRPHARTGWRLWAEGPESANTSASGGVAGAPCGARRRASRCRAGGWGRARSGQGRRCHRCWANCGKAQGDAISVGCSRNRCTAADTSLASHHQASPGETLGAVVRASHCWGTTRPSAPTACGPRHALRLLTSNRFRTCSVLCAFLPQARTPALSRPPRVRNRSFFSPATKKFPVAMPNMLSVAC